MANDTTRMEADNFDLSVFNDTSLRLESKREQHQWFYRAQLGFNLTGTIRIGKWTATPAKAFESLRVETIGDINNLRGIN